MHPHVLRGHFSAWVCGDVVKMNHLKTSVRTVSGLTVCLRAATSGRPRAERLQLGPSAGGTRTPSAGSAPPPGARGQRACLASLPPALARGKSFFYPIGAVLLCRARGGQTQLRTQAFLCPRRGRSSALPAAPSERGAHARGLRRARALRRAGRVRRCPRAPSGGRRQ